MEAFFSFMVSVFANTGNSSSSCSISDFFVFELYVSLHFVSELDGLAQSNLLVTGMNG